MEFRWNRDTPKAYLNHTAADKKKYAQDTEDILKKLQYFLKNHQKSFHSKEYFDSTQLSMDTILYSPDFTKLAVFVIAKNPTSRQLAPDERYDWYYNAYCYLGIRQKDSIDLISIDEGHRSYFKKKASEALRTDYFRLYATIKDVNGEYKYKYNLNDIRFWNGPAWKEIDDNKEQRREFEKMKKEHPENVFEPKE